jgi:hypothetical protein
MRRNLIEIDKPEEAQPPASPTIPILGTTEELRKILGPSISKRVAREIVIAAGFTNRKVFPIQRVLDWIKDNPEFFQS